MITDEVSIYNLALNAVGTRSNISLPTEESREAEICRLWFGPVRDRVLHAAPWASTKAWKRLSLRKERDQEESWVSDDPEPGFQFAYAPPNDMLRPRHLAGFQRFSLSTYASDRMAIMTNEQDALLCYSMRQTSIGLWDSGLSMAIVWGLASYIAMPLTGKASRAQLAVNEANNLIMAARADNANFDDAPLESIPSWIAARGYSMSLESTRYIYPTGALFSAGELGV